MVAFYTMLARPEGRFFTVLRVAESSTSFGWGKGWNVTSAGWQVTLCKLVINLKKIPYKDRLMHLKLPTLKYRRLRGDMTEVFKITHNIYDPEVSLELRYYPKSNTRGNKYKLLNHRAYVSLRYTKVFFFCTYS